MAKFLSILLMGFVAVSLTTGCDKSETAPAGPQADSKIPVIATVYPIAELVARVGGSRIDVRWYSEGAHHPDEVEETADLRQRTSDARLIITSGPWDEWAWRGLSADARGQRLIEPERMPASTRADPRAYLWLDPRVMQDILERATEQLAVIRPTDSALFHDNAATILSEIATVDAEFSKAIKSRASRDVLVASPVWSAMLKRYGLTQIAPVEGPEHKLSRADYRTLSSAAAKAGLKTIYVDAATPVAVRQQIEVNTGLKTLDLEATGTSAPSGRSTYAKLMRYNLQQLLAH